MTPIRVLGQLVLFASLTALPAAQELQRLRDQVPRPASVAAIADMDGDGDPDLVEVQGEFAVYRNDGSGRFARTVIDPGPYQGSITVIDVLGSEALDRMAADVTEVLQGGGMNRLRRRDLMPILPETTKIETNLRGQGPLRVFDAVFNWID